MASSSPGLGKGKSSKCKACGSTEHFRSSSSECPYYKPKTKTLARQNLKRQREGDDTELYNVTSVTRTITLPIKQVLLVPELEDVILFTVEQVTRSVKYLSEVLNTILVESSESEFSNLDPVFLTSIVSSITTSYNKNITELPQPTNLLEVTRNNCIESFRSCILPQTENFKWPVKVSNPTVFAVNQYFTLLKNHATVQFSKRLERYVKWKSRLQFPEITKHHQWTIWSRFQRRFDTFFTNDPPKILEEHKQFVDMLYDNFKPLLPTVENPIANAHSEQKDHWHTYLGIMKKILIDIENTTYHLEALELDTKRPPHKFSLAPISSFQHHHIMLDSTGCQNLFALHRKRNGLKVSDFPNLKFEQVFDKTRVENTTGTRIISGTLTTDGLQVSFHTMKRVRYLKEKPEQPVFEQTPIYENTYVLGMDPNKPGGCVAGGIPTERGVKPTISFNISRNEYFDKSGVYDARRRLEWYTFDNGYNKLINSITTAKTCISAAAFERLATVSIVSEVLFKGYFNGPSRQDRWRTTLGKNRILHRMARRVAILGRRDDSEKDFEDIRIARRKKKAGKVERKTKKERGQPLHKPRPDIVFVIGDVGFTHNEGISGTTMALKKLCYILKSHRYVRALVQENEDRTSQECNCCFHAGNPMFTSNVRFGGKESWRLKRCEGCGTYWNRDVNAALNIRSVFLYRNENGGQRPVNFIKGFKGHVVAQ